MSDLTLREVLLTVGTNQGDLYPQMISAARRDIRQPTVGASSWTWFAQLICYRNEKAGGDKATTKDVLILACDLCDYYAEHIKELSN